jgi:hypothetical protein
MSILFFVLFYMIWIGMIAAALALFFNAMQPRRSEKSTVLVEAKIPRNRR